MMQALLRAYNALTTALAAVAGIIMSAIFIAVILDVVMRNVGIEAPPAIEPLCEFGLLYITMLGSPWLLRTRGMIIVESLRMAVPPGPRRVLEIVVYVVSAAICFTLAWYAGYETIFAWANDEADQRAISVPLYCAYAPMLLGFFLMGCEFLRRLLAHDTLYTQSAIEGETI
jgi:TRAP-type C4-dicarboxylate transport system permease small subunit